MDTLAHVQFCRMRLSAYSVLLQSLLQTTASSPEVGSAKHSIPERSVCDGCDLHLNPDAATRSSCCRP